MTDKKATLLKKYAPITKAQLRNVVAHYVAQFPDWTMFVDGAAFVRCQGPIRQMIWFQKMSSAAYRPTHVIETTVNRIPSMLTQILDVKHREIEYRWHERKFEATIAAMEQQFRPDIRKPLDIIDVLGLCEAEAATMPDTSNNMAMLAILNAWLGRDAEALDCCERIQHCPLPTLAPMPEWEAAMRAFGHDLAKAVDAGTGRAFLEAAVEPVTGR